MLKVKKITKVFNRGTVNEKTALTGIDLSIKPGEFVTVIGGNGAGKSTLLNCIAGVYPVDSGTIAVDGHDVTRLPEYRRARYMGRVFQDPMMGTASDMTIEENLALAMRRGAHHTLRWMVRSNEHKQYRDLLSQLGLQLEDRMTVKVGLLSGGQRQALTLLMATLKTPKILLLDEHTAALDPKTALKVLALTKKFIGECSLTTLMVTHNMRDAIDYGNRLIMMDNGRIVVDISGEKKMNLHKADLMVLFEKASGSELNGDRLLLS